MSNIYSAIINSMKSDYKKIIAEADANPKKRYELFVSEGEEIGTHTVKSAKTFDEVVIYYEKYATKYGVDRTYIDIWKTYKTGKSDIESNLYHEHNIYAAIRDYLIFTGEITKFRMVGIFRRDENGNIRYIKKHSGEGYYFYDGIARTYFKDRIFYIPERSASNGKYEQVVIVTKRGKRRDGLYTVNDVLRLRMKKVSLKLQLHSV